VISDDREDLLNGALNRICMSEVISQQNRHSASLVVKFEAITALMLNNCL